MLTLHLYLSIHLWQLIQKVQSLLSRLLSATLELVLLLCGGIDELRHLDHVVLELAFHLQLLEDGLLLAALGVAGLCVIVYRLAHAWVHV